MASRSRDGLPPRPSQISPGQPTLLKRPAAVTTEQTPLLSGGYGAVEDSKDSKDPESQKASKTAREKELERRKRQERMRLIDRCAEGSSNGGLLLLSGTLQKHDLACCSSASLQ
mmetsp:Transcript_10254/g.38854  ORF Transcript_10254/g.38854 Transcript_10254/m.38854 type:complete len:114 (+) Transcript_10254:261-602(+)